MFPPVAGCSAALVSLVHCLILVTDLIWLPRGYLLRSPGPGSDAMNLRQHWHLHPSVPDCPLSPVTPSFVPIHCLAVAC